MMIKHTKASPLLTDYMVKGYKMIESAMTLTSTSLN